MSCGSLIRTNSTTLHHRVTTTQLITILLFLRRDSVVHMMLSWWSHLHKKPPLASSLFLSLSHLIEHLVDDAASTRVLFVSVRRLSPSALAMGSLHQAKRRDTASPYEVPALAKAVEKVKRAITRNIWRNEVRHDYRKWRCSLG